MKDYLYYMHINVDYPRRRIQVRVVPVLQQEVFKAVRELWYRGRVMHINVRNEHRRPGRGRTRHVYYNTLRSAPRPMSEFECVL